MRERGQRERERERERGWNYEVIELLSSTSAQWLDTFFASSVPIPLAAFAAVGRQGSICNEVL